MALSAWGISPESAQAAETVASELVTNAYQAARRLYSQPGLHGPDADASGRIGLTLRLLPSQVVIEVSDCNPSLPVMPCVDLESESGRGLTIVEALARKWGHETLPSGGKVVYAIIDAPD